MNPRRRASYLLVPVVGTHETRYAIVDRIDFRVLRYSWFINANGYAKRTTRKVSRLRPNCQARSIQLHHEVMRFDDGCEGEYVIDHLNGDRLDCRRSNLVIMPARINNELAYARKNGDRQGCGPRIIERPVEDRINLSNLPPF